MLFFALSWSIFTAVCLPIGLLILQAVKATSIDRIGDRLIISLWLGIVVLGVILLTASFFFPLTPFVAASVSAGTIIAAHFSPSVRDEIKSFLKSLSSRWFLIFFLLALTVAAFMTQLVVCTDAGLYHIQSIKWLAQYGTTPGIALIHARLGFTSSWFALAAPFHSGDFAARANAMMAGLGLTWLLIHGAILVYRFLITKARYEDWFMMTGYLICLPYILGLNFAVSSSPDLPVIYLVMIVAWTILISSNRDSSSDLDSAINMRLVPLILSAGAIAIKPTAAPLFAVALLFYLQRGGKGAIRLLIASIICSILIIPVLISGWITSGCALFPAPYFCGDFPWSVGPDLAKKVNTMNQSYERWMDYTSAGSFGWIIPWLNRNRDSAIFIAGLFAAAVAFEFSNSLKKVKAGGWIILTALCGILFVLCTVPTRRFALGYFALPPALVAPIYRKIVYPLIVITPLALEADWEIRKIRFFLLVVCLFVTLYMAISKSELMRRYLPLGFIVLSIVLSVKVLVFTATSNIVAIGKNMMLALTPPAVSKTELEIWEEKQVNDLKYIQSMRPYPDGRCWAAKLPCTPWLLHHNVRLRNPVKGLAGGVIKNE